MVSQTPDGHDNLTWGLSSGSTAFNLINEATPNDSSFISAGTGPIPAAQRVTLSALPLSVTVVRGLMTYARARKTDGGDANLQVGLVSGASTDAGDIKPLTTSYSYYNDIVEVDPATGVSWLPLAVNAAILRFNRTL